MDALLTKLDYDTSELVIKATVDSIRKECTALYKGFIEAQRTLPEEPTSGKASYVWTNYMINYTSIIKPKEVKIRNTYIHIMSEPIENFDEINLSYVIFKKLIANWHELQRKYRFSDYYRF